MTNLTAGVDLSHLAKPEPNRNQYGHYLIPNGKKGKEAGTRAYRRVSTVVKVLDETTALEAWGERMVAKGMTLDQSLVAMAATHDPDVDKGAFRDITKKAKELAKASSKRDLGTALHKSVEQWVGGTAVRDTYVGHHGALFALEAEIERKGLTLVEGSAERIVVLDDLGLAGTVDFLPLLLPSGEPVVGDLKTGSIGAHSWLGWGQQTCAYARHDATYDVATDKRGPRVEVSTEKAIVLHLPSMPDDEGNWGCTAYEVDIRHAYTALLLSIEAEEMRKSAKGSGQFTSWGQPYSPLSIGDIRGWLADRITAIAEHESTALDDLVAEWPPGVPTPLPPTFDPGQPEALDAVLSDIEGRHGLPIAPSPPGTTVAGLAKGKADE